MEELTGKEVVVRYFKCELCGKVNTYIQLAEQDKPILFNLKKEFGHSTLLGQHTCSPYQMGVNKFLGVRFIANYHMEEE